MTAKEKVLSVYPDAVCKRYKQDMCKPFYVICKEPLQLFSEHNCISKRTKYAKDAWQSALNQLIKQGLCTE